MDSCRKDFSMPEGRVWLNCAHQGPMPRVAAAQARRVINEKTQPHLIRVESFDDVPRRLRDAISMLIQRPQSEVILANSASYGINVIVNGMRWERDDEVLVVQGDFPANVLPWFRLRERGVHVRVIEPHKCGRLEAEDIMRYVTLRTKLLCTSWVNSFTGWRIDLKTIGQVCKYNGILFVVNVSQGLGTLRLDLASASIDGITCGGYKWLCGPYGTGFFWCNPELRGRLMPTQVNWWPLRAVAQDILKNGELPEMGADGFDIFCTANFMNYVPWIASIEYLLKNGLGHVADYNATLVNKIVDNVDWRKYNLISGDSTEGRSPIVVLSSKSPGDNRRIHTTLLESGIDVALKGNNIRMAPHCYNSGEEIARAVDLLNQVGQA